MNPGWRRRVVACLSAVAVTVAAPLAASVGGAAGAAPAAHGKAVTHTVTIDGTRYQPAQLTVHAGDTIVWVNKDLVPHTVTAKAGAFDSKMLAAGASWRFTAARKGGYDYHCQFHPTMAGRIDVD